LAMKSAHTTENNTRKRQSLVFTASKTTAMGLWITAGVAGILKNHQTSKAGK